MDQVAVFFLPTETGEIVATCESFGGWRYPVDAVNEHTIAEAKESLRTFIYLNLQIKSYKPLVVVA